MLSTFNYRSVKRRAKELTKGYERNRARIKTGEEEQHKKVLMKSFLFLSVSLQEDEEVEESFQFNTKVLLVLGEVSEWCQENH